MEIVTIAVGCFIAVSLCVLGVTQRAGRQLHRVHVAQKDELPSVSVCIPARNEAHALSACLDRVLASDYEKLEILVLDDESVDRTPTLIKSFAHAGVRFIAGKPLPSGWIGKNHALDTLVREASGELVLFLDVDVHISTRTISNIVDSMGDGANILSLIPRRYDTYRASALFGHLRYLWDVIQVGLGGTSASASMWCVRREWLLRAQDGFESVQDVIRPELFFATNSKAHSLFYRGSEYGVHYEKHWQSQAESSQRLIVPTIRYYGLRAYCLVSWLILAVVALPLALWLVLAQPTYGSMLLFYGTFLLGYGVQYGYLRQVWQSQAWIGALLWWWSAAQELLFVILSVVRYSTKTVTWKGRSIHAQPKNDDYYSI